MRMRVIEADDLESTFAGCSPSVEVIFGVHQEPHCRIVGDVARPRRLGNGAAAAQQQAAALVRRRFPCVRHDLTDDFIIHNGQLTIHTSIAIAIPIPPPMQSEATP